MMPPRPAPAPGPSPRPAIPRLDGRERAPWESEAFRADVLGGLARPQKAVPPKYFYDRAGAALFDEICSLPEYYVTRAELEILTAHADEIAACIGPGATLAELGSGRSVKTRLLLDRLADPRAYVPIDIEPGSLATAVLELRHAYPGLLVQPVCADFTQSFTLPPAAASAQRLAVFFPGSTIGNLEPRNAMLLLRKIRRRLGHGGLVIVGVDTRKPAPLLERAYNDARGVTAAFNRNLLVRIRRELEADVDPAAFDHVALWQEGPGRIEMHLRSRCAQTVRLDGFDFPFRAGETLHTENSYKYAPEEFAALAREAGFDPRWLWRHPEGLFAVHGLCA
jgi:L-histidine Nalpha-methyltransferase